MTSRPRVVRQYDGNGVVTFDDFLRMRVLKKASEERKAKQREAQREKERTEAMGFKVWEAEDEETAESPMKKARPLQRATDKENLPADKGGKAAAKGRLGMRRDPTRRSKATEAHMLRVRLEKAAAAQDQDMILRRETVYRF